MFAWGRPLELSRRFAIYSCALMLLIAATAGAIVWARRSQSAKPYFLYITRDGEWVVYSERLRAQDSELPWHRLLQESIAVKYARDYMRVTNNLAESAEVLWCRCKDNCDGSWNQCRICCMSDAGVFNNFENFIMPEWRKKFGGGETLELADVAAAAMGEIEERGGTWKLTGTLISNKSDAKRITAFVKIERMRSGHAQTLGYYVSGFDFYLE